MALREGLQHIGQDHCCHGPWGHRAMTWSAKTGIDQGWQYGTVRSYQDLQSSQRSWKRIGNQNNASFHTQIKIQLTNTGIEALYSYLQDPYRILYVHPIMLENYACSRSIYLHWYQKLALDRFGGRNGGMCHRLCQTHRPQTHASSQVSDKILHIIRG